MIDWFKSLPKTMFVTLVLGTGVIFIILSDPPRTLCDSQLDIFNEDTKKFLTVDPAQPIQKISRYAKLRDTCKLSNSPGGCFEFFAELKKMLKEAKSVSPECYKKLSSNGPFSSALWESLDIMVQMAWGSQPPLTMALRAGWFDAADLNLYCELKSKAASIYSEERWKNFIEGYFKSLPGAEKITRSEVWQKMLFSTNCSSYL